MVLWVVAFVYVLIRVNLLDFNICSLGSENIFISCTSSSYERTFTSRKGEHGAMT